MRASASSRAAVWNFSIVGFNKLAQTVGSIAFVLLIPKMLGAEQFGQFAFVTSLLIIASRVGDLGMEDVLVRFIPESVSADKDEAVRRLAGRLMAVRLALGLFSGLAAAIWALNTTTWMTPLQGVLIGLTISLYVLALLPFEILLGLGQAGKWTFNSSWRQFALILTLGLLFQVLDLGFDGVILALFVNQVFFVSLGLWWARAYLSWRHIRFDWLTLRPYLMAGGVFFAANLFLAAVHRGGALAIEVLTHDTAQIGFFDLGTSIYLMLFLSMTQAMIAVLPLASNLHAAGEQREVGRWFALLQRFGVVLAMMIVGGVWGLAPVLVGPVFGEAFQPAIGTMRLSILALAVMMLGYPAGMLSVVWREPHIRFWSTLCALAASLATMSAIPVWGANGAALAMVVGVMVYVLVIWYFVRRRIQQVRPLVGLAWGKGMLALVLGLVYLPLFALDTFSLESKLLSPLAGGGSLTAAILVATAATTLATAVYLVLVFVFKVVSLHEIRLILRTLKHTRS